MANQIKYQVGFDVDKSSLNQIKTSLQQLSRVKLSDIMKINGTDAQGAREILADIKEKAQQVEQALTKAFNTKLNTANIQEFKNQLKSLNIQDLYSSFSRAGAAGEVAFRQVSTQLLSTNIQLKESNTLLNKMGTTFLNTIKWNIASSAINAMSRSIQQAWGFTKDLDTSLNDIRIVTGKSADEMANFAEQANKAAQNLGQTTTNYTKASLIYYQQGLQDAEVQARTDVTLKAANVTGQSAQQVSEQLTAVWNGYKVSAEQTEVYVDRLAAVAATSASNLEELSTGMSKVASAAAAMGVGEEQLAAQLSTIISVTRQAPQSVGTALRTIFARVADIKAGLDQDGVTLGNYSGKMAELGINVLDMNGNLRDMGEVMEQIGAKWGDMSRQQQVYLARTMAGQRQYNNLLALFDNFEMYNKELEVAQNATGTLQKQQDTYMESTEAHLKQLRAALEGVYEKAINTESINNLIDGLKVATNFMAQFIQSLGGGGAALSSLGSIAMMVFSKQIGASLATTINNMKIAREQTQFFKQAMVEAQQLQNKNIGNTYSKELLADQSKMMALAAGGSLTPESFNQIKESLLEFRDIADNLDLVKEKAASIQQAFDNTSPSVAALIKQMGGLNEVLNDSGKMNMVQEQIQKIATAFEPFKDKINETKDLWNDLVKNTFGKDLNIEENLNKAVASAERLRVALKSTVQELHSNKIDGKSLFSMLPEQAQNAITETNHKLAHIKIDKTNFEASRNDIKTLYTELVSSLENKKAELETSLSHTDINSPEWANLQQKIQAISKALEEAKLKKDSFLQSGTNTAMIQQFTAITSGITSMAMAIRNLQNLGSILKNQDLSTNEKILQVVLNLGMAIGMIIPALSKLNGILKLVTVATTQEQIAAMTAGSTELLHAGALSLVKDAAGKAQIQIALLNKTIMVNPYLLIIAAVIALAAALGSLVNAYNQSLKAAIQADKALIDQQNKKQELIDKNRELVVSLRELEEQQKNGTISRLDLKNSIEDLINSYDLEAQSIRILRNRYLDLTEAIGEFRKKQAQKGAKSAETELSAAARVVTNSAEGEWYNTDDQYFLGNRYKVDFTGMASTDEPIGAAFQRYAGQYLGNKANSLANSFGFAGLETDNSPESIVNMYDAVAEAVNYIYNTESNITDEQRTNNKFLKEAQQWLGKMKDSVESYKAALEDVQKYEIELTALTNNTFDSGSIKSAQDYFKQRDQFINAIENNSKIDTSKTSAEDLADTYLFNYEKDLYKQYDIIIQYTNELKKRLGGTNTEIDKTISLMNGLDEEHLVAIMDASKYKDSWEQIYKLIEFIGNTDLSNIGNAFGKNLDVMRSTASQAYNTFQSLYDKIGKGQALSSEEFQGLSDQLKQFFGYAADGTYKMIGDFTEFANKVNNLKFNGFKQNLIQLRKSLQGLLNLQQVNSIAEKNNLQTLDPNKLGKEDEITIQKDTGLTGEDRGREIVGYTKELNQQRLQYLELLNQGNDAELKQINEWKEKNAQGELTIKQQQIILEKVQEIDDVTKDLTIQQLEQEAFETELAMARMADSYKELQQLAATPIEQGGISKAAFDQASFEMHERESIEDLDLEQIQNYADYLQDLASSEEDAAIGAEQLSKDIISNEDSAKQLAIQISRMNKGVKDLADNWEDWSDVLANSTKGSNEYLEALTSTKDALADLLDLSADSISSTLIDDLVNSAEGMDLMARAAEGNGDAIDQLRQKTLEDFIVHLQLDDSQLTTDQILAEVTNIQSLLDGLDLTITPGMDLTNIQLGESSMVQMLNDLIQSTGMGVDQVNQLLRSMGFKATFKKQDNNLTTKIPEYTTYHTVTPGVPVTINGGTPDEKTVQGWSETTYTEQTGEHNATTTFPSYAMTTDGSSPQIETLTAMASGGANNYSSSNRGGSGGSKSSGGGGGGGSSKAAEPDTSQKDTKKPMEDTRDIYHDINIEIERINRNLDRVQKKQDRLYGQQLLNNLNKQTAILEQHKDKLKEKQKLQEEDLANQRKELESLGVIFDKYGNINNYMAILAQKQADINSLTNHYNDIIGEYNKSTDKDQKKLIADDAEAVNKQLKELEDEYKDLESKIKDYDGLREDMEDLVDEIEEETQKQIELNIQKFRMELEIRLDMGEAQRDWNEFRRRVLDKTDVIKDTDFDSIFQDALQNINDIYSYFDIGGSRGAIQTLTQQLIRTKEEIEAIDKIGESVIYGDNKAQAMEDLQNDLDELMSQMEDMEDLIDAVDEAYLDTIDDIADQFDKQIEDYEFIGELLEHDMDLLTLLYGDKNYDAMEKYYTSLAENNNKQLDFLRQQAAYWKENWEAATAAGDIQAAKEFEKHYKDTISNLSSVIEESAQNLQDKYLNAIDKIFDALDQKITNGKGLDYLDMEWELVNKNADEYLDTINSAFAVQELQNKFQKAIDDTKNIKNQQTLKKLMDEQLNNLRTKEKLTEYDVQRAEKLLQIEQARIALENAKSSKTTMRLKRNAQGNYSYEYVANGEGISDAQDALAAARNDLYNFDKDRYRSNLDDMLAAWKDFQSKYKDIVTDTSLTEQQRVEKTALLREQYGQYINDKTAENLIIRNNLMESAFADLAALYEVDVANYNQMSIDEQDILMNDLIPAWKGGIQQMTDAVAGAGGFIPTCQDAFEDIRQTTKNYERELDNMARIAGVDFDLIKQGINDTSTELSQLIEENDDLINSIKTEMDTISQLRTTVQNFVTDYNNVYDAAKQTVTAIQDFTREQEKAAAAAKNLKQQVEAVAEATKKANAISSSSSYTAPKASSSSSSSGSGSSGGSSGGGSTGGAGAGASYNSGKSSSHTHTWGKWVKTGEWYDNSGNLWYNYYAICSQCGAHSAQWSELIKKGARATNTGGCFAAGTKIIMADLSIKNIEDININDEVIAYNTEKQIYESKYVIDTLKYKTYTNLIQVYLSNGVVLKMTPGHPLLTTQGWKSLDLETSKGAHGIQATLLEINDEVLGFNGNSFILNIQQTDSSQGIIVYDIEVDECHTFLADSMVVHNANINTKQYYDTGGYTGDWHSDEGKIAVLHQKELVLNQDDTQNLLDSVSILRSLLNSSNNSIMNKITTLNDGNRYSTIQNLWKDNDNIDQAVHIDASFPNVNSKKEIEDAFSELINLAAQRALKR